MMEMDGDGWRLNGVEEMLGDGRWRSTESGG